MTSTRPTNRCVSWDAGGRLPRRSHGASHPRASDRGRDVTSFSLPVASVPTTSRRWEFS
jgi:hypothetical protein